MWFHGDDMVCTCYRQHICSNLGGHWGPRLALLILPGLREAWDDCSNQAGWGHLADINHDQKLPWIFTDLSTTILHNIDIFFLHTLADFHAGPMFAEFLGHSLAQLQVQVVSTVWELPLKTLIFVILAKYPMHSIHGSPLPSRMKWKSDQILTSSFWLLLGGLQYLQAYVF